MNIIIPFDLQNGVNASVTVNDLVESLPPWTSGYSYVLGDEVYYGQHKYARRVSGAGTTTPDVDLVNWRDAGPSNRWALFDNKNSTFSSAYAGFTVEVSVQDLFSSTGPVPNLTKVSVAMFGLVGVSAVLTTYLGNGTTANYNESFSISRWDESSAGSKVIQNLGLNAGYATRIRVNMSGMYGPGLYVDSKCSTLVVGQSIDIGTAQASPTLGLISYSKKETDEFGVTTFVKGKNSKRLTVKSVIQNSALDSVYCTLAMLDGVPCVLIVSDIANLKPLNAFGFIKDFSIEVPYVNESLCSIEFESLA